MVVLGRAAILEHELLPDRRHVLTRNSDELVQRWNILNGTVAETYEGQTLKEVVSASFPPLMPPRLVNVSHTCYPSCSASL